MIRCEFPEQINWDKIKVLGDLDIAVYVAVKTRKQFNGLAEKLKEARIREIGAWPILPKKAGYWFSGFTARKDINKLGQFRGFKIKIDISILFYIYGF